MQKKALIFDCFGVIVSPPISRWILDNLGNEFDMYNFFKKFDLGEMSNEDMLSVFSKLVRRSPNIIRNEIITYCKLDLELIDYIKYLKSQKYKIILLSNANHSFFEQFVCGEYPWFRDLFDHITISSKIKMIKPNSDIYLHALRENNLKPEDAIFIDDSNSNILGAENIGISSILFENTDQLKKELLKYDISEK